MSASEAVPSAELLEPTPSKLAISHSDPWWQTTISAYTTGVIYVASGHPFDTLRIRIQTGALHHFYRHLYRGILPPLLTTPPSWSINFLLYQASLNIFASDSLYNVYFAGGVSGFIWATCMSPPELIKCYAQRYHMTTPNAMAELYHKLGGSLRSYITKGLFRGFTAAVVRDVPATAAYFWCMECVRRYIPGYNDSKVVLPFLAGCAAGVGAWTFAMPGDTVKSIIQTEFALANNIAELPSGSFIFNAKKLLRENNGNFLRFYRGFNWVVARAIVTSGVGIVGLENMTRWFKDN